MQRVVSFLFLLVFLSCIPLYAQVSDKPSGSYVLSGNWEVGYLNEYDEYLPFNTTFTHAQGISGWCLDGCPGLFGDITVNTTDETIDLKNVKWEPGQMLINQSLVGKGVVLRWYSDVARNIRLSFLMKGKANSGCQAKVFVKNEFKTLNEYYIDCTQKGDDRQMKSVNAFPDIKSDNNYLVSRNGYIDIVFENVSEVNNSGWISVNVSVSNDKNVVVSQLGNNNKKMLQKFLVAMRTQQEKVKLSQNGTLISSASLIENGGTK